jgi:hypothetical protein
MFPGVYRVRADTQESRYDRQNGYDTGEKKVRAAMRCPTHVMTPHEWGTLGMSGLCVLATHTPILRKGLHMGHPTTS